MTDSRDRRINARIDSELERKLSYLRERTKQSTTDVVREAIERYHAAIGETAATPAEILERAGFIGCFAGPRDLSVRYKDELDLSLAKKA
jgi:predicted DNA-binding protein